MKFRFSSKVTIIGAVLILAMLRMSYWQWQRHQSKQVYIGSIQERLKMPTLDLSSILAENKTSEELPYRRVSVKGNFDFAHEMILRNRKLAQNPGVFVLTPFKIDGSDKYVLVSRGFIPLAYSTPDKRKIFQHPQKETFVGLIKETSTPLFLAPSDPPAGKGNPWVDAWLRVNLAEISQQLPYPLLPFYLEVMSSEDSKLAEDKIVTGSSERDEIFFLAGKTLIPKAVTEDDLSKYPVAVFDTVIPPGRHLGYVFEWAVMSLMTFLICLVLQFRRPKE